MQGRLKSITLASSQETWRLDLPAIRGTAAPVAHGQPQDTPRSVPGGPGAHGQLQEPPHQVPITEERPASDAAPARRNQKRPTSTPSEPILDRDDDDFMPSKKQHACACASISSPVANLRRTIGEPTNSKGQATKCAVTRPPSTRCAPSVFNKLTEHLTMPQRRKISELGFGGLLQFSAEGLECSDLLVYLMDKLNPGSMILEVGHEGGLQINEFSVNKVIGIPNGDKDLPSSTEEENTRALVDFRKLVYVDPNKEVKCRHLLDLVKKCALDTDLAVRIFFIVAFNKLLFPALDTDIRGRDAFLTKYLSQFANMNWCKAVVDELRHAAITWRSEKKKSISGCTIFLIIFYLDNLHCHSSIVHFATPRAKFFHKNVMENIILEDKREDKFGNVTYGNLQLRNIANTCYHCTEPARDRVPASADSTSPPILPRAEQELGVFLSQIASSPTRLEASDSMKLFDAKASHAIGFVQSGCKMLVDAQKDFIRAMGNIMEKEVLQRRRKNNVSPYPSPIHNDVGEDHVTRSNEDFSFFRSGGAYTDETYERRRTAPSDMASPVTHHSLIDQAIVPQEESGMHMQGEPYTDAHSHTVVTNQNSGPAQAGLAATPPAQTTQHITTASIFHSTAYQMAPDIGSFAPDIDTIIRDIRQAEKIGKKTNSPYQQLLVNKDNAENTVTGPVNRDHVQPVQTLNKGLPMASTDSFVPPIHTGSCIDPITPVQSFNLHADHDTGLPDDRVSQHLESDVPVRVTQDADLGGMIAATQDESGYHIRARPRIDRLVNVPARYRSPFKCITPRPAIDKMNAIAVRTKLCSDLKGSRKFVIMGPTQCLNCKDIADSFADGAPLFKSLMSYFVDCLRAEDEIYRPKCVGFRVFLSGYLGEMLNHDEERLPTSYPDLAAFIRLTADIGDLDVNKVKLFFVPIRQDDHYTVYCFNMVDQRIEVLDSSTEDREAYHKAIGDRVVPRLNALFQKLTDGHFRDFSNWKRPIRNVVQVTDPNDSPFIGMKIMELWDGDKLHWQENNINMSELRSEMLFYMLYHPVNRVKNLPDGLEAYRPRA